MSEKKCGSCEHFERFATQNKGYCFGMPPTVFVSGSQDSPKVNDTRRACSLFEALPEGQAPAVKQKLYVETPGDAAKARRAGK